MCQGLGRDLRIAARRLIATPLFTLFSVLSLGVGIGVTTIAYSLVDAFFFTGLPIHEPGRAVYVMTPGGGRFRFQSVISRPDFDDVRGLAKSFSRLAASQTSYVSVWTPATTELMQAEGVTGDYFSTLGVGAALGRAILPSDGGAAVAVLGHDLWRARFAGDPGVLGRTVRIGGRPFEIVGVAPRSFAGVTADGPFGARVWVPIEAATGFAAAARSFASAHQSAAPTPDRERRELTVIGRLRDGVNVERAAAEVAQLAAALDSSYPNTVPLPGSQFVPLRGWTARTVAEVRGEATERTARLGVVMAGLVLLVLAVACTNLANLVVARGTTRLPEVAVRRALGASRWRLVREQGAESLLVALAGGAAACLVMRGLSGLLAIDFALPGSPVVSLQPAMDASMLLAAAAALLVSLTVFGLEPAIQLTRTRDVRGELARSAGGLGDPRAKRQRLLLRWQVAISTGFFILASLSVRYVLVELGHDPGVELDRFAVAMLNFQAQGWDEARARRALDRVIDEAARQPGIESVAVSTGLPLSVFMPRVRLSTPDRPLGPKGAFALADANLVAATPRLFQTIGLSILRGRGFDDRDRDAASAGVVVNETAARAVFGTADAVGRQIVMQVTGRGAEPPVQTVTIAGVARDTDAWYLSSRRSALVYVPFDRCFDPVIAVTARSASGDTSAASGALRTAIRRADPDVAIASIGGGRALLTGPYVVLRFFGFASLSLGLLTLALAMVGLYGVQASGVTQRTREIGIRMSFGATAGRIMRMIMNDGYRPVIEGMAIGVFIGLSGRAIIRTYLDAPISILDPWMLAIVPIPLTLAAFFACYLPARRAAAIDPIAALRHI